MSMRLEESPGHSGATSISSPRPDQRQEGGGRRGLVLILIQIAVTGIWMSVSGRFTANEVIDSASYREFPWDSLQTILGDFRTPGYPAFLKALQWVVGAAASAIPLTQYLLYASAVMLMYFALYRFLEDSAKALAGASTLLYSNILHNFCSDVSTDTIAAAVGLMVCGLLLLTLTDPRIRWFVALGFAVVAGWQIRPAYLFLVPFVTVVTWVAGAPKLQTAVKRRIPAVLIAGAIVSLPMIGYSMLRYSVTGHFGVVSFGGYNVAGIAGQFLVKDDIPLLSPDLQQMATEAIERRDSGQLRPGLYDDLPVMNYMRLEDRHDLTISFVLLNYGGRIPLNERAEVNRKLTRLARELIMLHPRAYLTWHVKAWRQAFRKLMWDFADNYLSFALMVATVLMLTAYVILPARGTLIMPGLNRELFLAVLALTYCILSLFFIIPFCPPRGRFTDAAGVLLPAPIAILLWATANSFLLQRKSPGHGSSGANP
ncbi:MAG: hypothetical protein ACK526_17390 [Planctomyces sp.]|jgi:hypothetical protein